MDTLDTLTALTGTHAAALRHQLHAWLGDTGGKISDAETSDDLLEAIADAHALARVWTAVDHGQITLDLQTRSLLAFWRDDLREAKQENRRNAQQFTPELDTEHDEFFIDLEQRIAALDELLATATEEAQR